MGAFSLHNIDRLSALLQLPSATSLELTVHLIVERISHAYKLVVCQLIYSSALDLFLCIMYTSSVQLLWTILHVLH